MVPARGNGSVEMFGLCGAGKTTLARDLLLAAESDPAGVGFHPEDPVRPTGWVSVLMAGRYAVGYGLRDPGGGARLLGSPAGRWLFLKLGYRIAGLRMRGDLTGSLLLDSGVLQPLVSFDVEYNLPLIQWDVERLAKTLPLPSCALYVRVEPEVAMQRYLDRERKQGGTVPMERIEERFARGFRTAEQLYEVCVALGVRCTVCDNKWPVSRETLAGIVARLLGEKVGK